MKFAAGETNDSLHVEMDQIEELLFKEDPLPFEDLSAKKRSLEVHKSYIYVFEYLNDRLS